MTSNPYESADSITNAEECRQMNTQRIYDVLTIMSGLAPIAASGFTVWFFTVMSTEYGGQRETLSAAGHCFYLFLGAGAGIIFGIGTLVTNMCVFRDRKEALAQLVVTFIASAISALCSLVFLFLISESVFYMLPRSFMDKLTTERRQLFPESGTIIDVDVRQGG